MPERLMLIGFESNRVIVVGRPEATDTFKPIAHNILVNAVGESLSYRRIRIERSEFAVSKDGMKMFGLLKVNNDFVRKNRLGLNQINLSDFCSHFLQGCKLFGCNSYSQLAPKAQKSLKLDEIIVVLA